jgi:hypothetical protein
MAVKSQRSNAPSLSIRSRSTQRLSRQHLQLARVRRLFRTLRGKLAKHSIEAVATGLPDFSGRECPFSRDLRGAANVVAEFTK